MKKYLIPAGDSSPAVGVLGGYVGLKAHVFYPTPPAPYYPKPQGSAREAQLQDLDYMGNISELDRSYSPAVL